MRVFGACLQFALLGLSTGSEHGIADYLMEAAVAGSQDLEL